MTAPMPFLCGLPAPLLPLLKAVPMERATLVDLDLGGWRQGRCLRRRVAWPCRPAEWQEGGARSERRVCGRQAGLFRR